MSPTHHSKIHEAPASGLRNAFTVDVEDYFQVEAFASVVSRDNWNSFPARVVQNTQRVLSILEAAEVRATFFVLGWVAEHFPALLTDIQRGGHEIASHGQEHRRATSQTPAEFRNDVRRAKAVLEDAGGVRVRGYRAPTFSINRSNWWSYNVLAEEGYEYSSSLYPVRHDLYGVPDAPRTTFRPLPDCSFLEIPITTIRLLSHNYPCGGGGYFRLLPYPVSEWCIRQANLRDNHPSIFYCHPWEFDPLQPRIAGASFKSRFRHYHNLAAMEPRVERLLRALQWGRVDEVCAGR